MASRIEIATKKNVYGWAAIVDFTLGSSAGFRDLESREASLLWTHNLILRIEPRDIHPLQRASGQTGYRLHVEAVDTASAAERLGVRLAYAILKVAIRRRWGLGLAWEDAPLPCRVVDRTRAKGLSATGFATITRYTGTGDLVDELEAGFSVYEEVPQRVILSMELYAATHLESNARVKLVMMVSALEALATQQDLSGELGETIQGMVNVVEAAEITNASLKESLRGRVQELARESARRALRRMLREHSLSEVDVAKVEAAYEARSKIVHEGRRVPDIASIVGPLDSVMQYLYSEL